VAPKGPSFDAPAFSRGGGSSAKATQTDTIRFSFVIDPSRSLIYDLGAGNALKFPAHTLCDPNKSSYGDDEWDKPCTLATSPLTESVKVWLDVHGHPQVDFSPDIRFVPTLDPTKYVSIQFADAAAAADPLYKILYCKKPKQNAQCIDESLIDPTLVTVRDPLTGHLERRIKHFSGYNVAAGRAMDSDMNRSPGSQMSDASGSMNRTHSGFMLASGRDEEQQ
jgi:hypothetical protein